MGPKRKQIALLCPTSTIAQRKRKPGIYLVIRRHLPTNSEKSTKQDPDIIGEVCVYLQSIEQLLSPSEAIFRFGNWPQDEFLTKNSKYSTNKVSNTDSQWHCLFAIKNGFKFRKAQGVLKILGSSTREIRKRIGRDYQGIELESYDIFRYCALSPFKNGLIYEKH